MTHRFIAVGVGRGDAFYLQREQFSALIDGGEATGFPLRLKRATGIDKVNVLVCTHNDRDHANGILEFLENGGQADECWLPASWLEATHRLFNSSEEELHSLLEPENEILPDEPERYGDAEVCADEVAELLSNSEDNPPNILQSTCIAIPWRLTPHGIVIPIQVFPVNAATFPWISDAARIVRIAMAANKMHIPIRWFDTDKPPTLVASSQLSVLNATPVTKIAPASLSLKGVINLTTVNRNSLVLHSSPDEAAPGILFCSDSGFRNVASPPTDVGMIVTAPHHGSSDRENVAVYSKLDSTATASSPPSWLWVRSDSDNKDRPCKEYLSRQNRYCTICRGQKNKLPIQDVVISGSGGKWLPSTALRQCSCI